MKNKNTEITREQIDKACEDTQNVMQPITESIMKRVSEMKIRLLIDDIIDIYENKYYSYAHYHRIKVSQNEYAMNQNLKPEKPITTFYIIQHVLDEETYDYISSKGRKKEVV